MPPTPFITSWLKIKCISAQPEHENTSCTLGRNSPHAKGIAGSGIQGLAETGGNVFGGYFEYVRPEGQNEYKARWGRIHYYAGCCCCSVAKLCLTLLQPHGL